MTQPQSFANRWQRIRELFDAAQSIADKQRPQWLATECGSDNELRKTLNGLLAASRAKTEIIDMAIEQASDALLDSLHSKPLGKSRAAATHKTPELSDSTRRAFICIEAFFYHSASARKETDAAQAAVDLNLARAFGSAARGTNTQTPTAQVKHLLATLHEGDASGEAIAALRYWLDVIEPNPPRK